MEGYTGSLDNVINYCNDEVSEDGIILKEGKNFLEIISKFNEFPPSEKEKFNMDKLKAIKNKHLRAELFCFVKVNNSISVQIEKRALAKELLELNKSKNENENDLNKKCEEIINPISRVTAYYYAHQFNNINLAHNSVSAKDFYSIEFIKILFDTNRLEEFYFIKESLKTKLLEEISPNSNIVYENLNKPTVNIFENIRQRHSDENDLSAWLVWVYAKFDYYDQTARNFTLIPEELRWQALNLLLEINQNNPDNVNITIDHINLLSEEDRKEALRNEIIRNELIRSRRNNRIGRGFGIGLMIADAAIVAGLIVGGVFAITNPFVWLCAGCTLIIGAIVIGVKNSKFKSINKLLNPKKYEPKSQEEEPLLGDSAERTSFQKLIPQATEEVRNQEGEFPNNLEEQQQVNDDPNFHDDK